MKLLTASRFETIPATQTTGKQSYLFQK